MWELSLLGISHAIFGIILLSAKEKKDRSDFLLIVWVSVLFLPFLKVFLSGFEAAVWGILRLNNQAFSLLNGPLLYLYIKEVARQDDSPAIPYWLHLLPFLFFYIFLVIKPAPLQPGGPINPLDHNFFILKYFGVINVAIYLVYAVVALKFLFQHSQKIKETFAYRNGEITLIWIVFLPFLFLVLVLIIVLVENSSLRNLINLEVLHLIVYLTFTLYIIFFGLRQKRIYPAAKEEPPERIKKSVDPNQDAQLLQRIKQVMDTEKLYQNPTLSVYDLAEAMNISRHRVSSLLNESLSMNFFQFVNQYRLDEVIRRLKEDSGNQFNILELAFDSGFNSKSSFNSLFKKQFGLTPSQYKKSVQIEIRSKLSQKGPDSD